MIEACRTTKHDQQDFLAGSPSAPSHQFSMSTGLHQIAERNLLLDLTTPQLDLPRQLLSPQLQSGFCFSLIP
ncbi:unnamed protein product, partial [Amoebophrya sp. A25]|eukprot:GSA25T00016158001.1